MRVVNIDNLEWIQVTVKELEDKAILILKPHINDLDWFEVEPARHGWWVFGGDGCVVCSECDEEEPNDIHRNYCPNCGAKMDVIPICHGDCGAPTLEEARKRLLPNCGAKMNLRKD